MALTTAKTPENTRRWGRYWLVGWVALAVALLARGLIGGSAGTADAERRAAAHSGVQATRLTKPIEQIQVGERVLAGNPADAEPEEDASLRSEIEPSSWRRVVLKAPKDDGSFARVTLLRPASWLAERRAAVGGTVPIAVPECGIGGDAEVLAIGPCPAVRPGHGQVVTGTFHHESARVVDVFVEGVTGPIGTTANHRFWSEDRQQFVAASGLRTGERLRGEDALLKVIEVVPRGTVEPVFNLEVQLDHVYHVSAAGILVHNSGEPKKIVPFSESLNLGVRSKGIVYVIKGKINGETQIYVGSTYDPERISGRTDHPARNLLENGKNVEVHVSSFDLEKGVAELMREERVSEGRAANRISRTYEQAKLEFILRKYGIAEVGGTNKKGTIRNLNEIRAQSEENVEIYRDRFHDWETQNREVTIRRCP